MSNKTMPPPAVVDPFEAVNAQLNNPAFTVGPTSTENLADWANPLLMAGRWSVVIDTLEVRPDLEQSHFALHILANALKFRGEEGDLERAEALLARVLELREAELAAGAPGAATCLSSSWSLGGEIAFIQGDHARAESRFLTAIEVDPTYWIAHECRLCMRSVAMDAQGCRDVLADLERCYPAWRSNAALRRTLLDDGMLDWFRSQPDLLASLTTH